MGTIRIEQHQEFGGANDTGDTKAPVPRHLIDFDEDTSTSTSAESITLSGSCSTVSVYAKDGEHRVAFEDDTTATKYYTIPDGQIRDIGVPSGGETLYYRTDA